MLFHRLFHPCSIALLGALALAFNPAHAQQQPAAAPVSTAACPALLQYTFPRLQDEKPQSLCQYAGRVVLIVNTASFCGFTPQYKGLEALHAKYKNQGLVVLGFPSNDFSQEPAANAQIADFCENTFGVQFPMFGKTSVTGAQAAPLFKALAKQTGTAPGWNFHKYLLARDGRVVANYASSVAPESAQLVGAIEKELKAK